MAAGCVRLDGWGFPSGRRRGLSLTRTPARHGRYLPRCASRRSACPFPLAAHGTQPRLHLAGNPLLRRCRKPHRQRAVRLSVSDPGACAMRRHREYPRCIGQGKDAPVLTCFRALRLRWPTALCTSSSFRAATPLIILPISALRLPLSQRGARELRQREAAKHARGEEVRPFPTSWTNRLPAGQANLQTMSLAGHP
jgi:hypothetical protein